MNELDFINSVMLFFKLRLLGLPVLFYKKNVLILFLFSLIFFFLLFIVLLPQFIMFQWGAFCQSSLHVVVSVETYDQLCLMRYLVGSAEGVWSTGTAAVVNSIFVHPVWELSPCTWSKGSLIWGIPLGLHLVTPFVLDFYGQGFEAQPGVLGHHVGESVDDISALCDWFSASGSIKWRPPLLTGVIHGLVWSV